MRNKRIITILMIFTIIFTLMGGTFAYWNWQSTTAQQTSVAFTVKSNFSCAADIGGNVSSTEANLIPTSDCTSADYAIQRTVTVKPTLSSDAPDDLSIAMDLWLEVESITSGVSNSSNFRYALTTSSESCSTGVVASGSFNGRNTGDTVTLLQRNYNATSTETYYLYIWLDAEETDPSTMNQTFELSINGECSQDTYTVPAAPVLDQSGMIPVTIANDGSATTILATDENWYDYFNQEWANVVLVTDDTREKYLGTTGVSVDSDDVLAQYVWIPRYKYKMPEASCSKLSQPENNLDCYQYIISDEDKTLFIEWWYEDEGSWLQEKYGVTYTMEQATEDVETMLSTGEVYIEEDDYTYTFVEVLGWYNSAVDPDITYSTMFNGDNMTSGPRSIDIVFEEGNAEMSTGDAVSTYRTHPAFWWDDDSNGSVDSGETIAGIWVGKFETTGIDTKPTILANSEALVYSNINYQLYLSLKFSESGNIYGLSDTSTSSHMMKNSEWGAVLYLSHSQYGINKKMEEGDVNVTGGIAISQNTNNILTSGKLSTLELNKSKEFSNISPIVSISGAYGNITNYPQSTTGNISGVFDMSGGHGEYMMANYNNYVSSSGLGAMPDSKYYDLYTSTDINTACNGGICYGHALSETINWYSYGSVWNEEYSWLLRMSGGGFENYTEDGSRFSDITWRSVIIVGFKNSISITIK